MQPVNEPALIKQPFVDRMTHFIQYQQVPLSRLRRLHDSFKRLVDKSVLRQFIGPETIAATPALAQSVTDLRHVQASGAELPDDQTSGPVLGGRQFSGITGSFEKLHHQHPLAAPGRQRRPAHRRGGLAFAIACDHRETGQHRHSAFGPIIYISALNIEAAIGLPPLFPCTVI